MNVVDFVSLGLTGKSGFWDEKAVGIYVDGAGVVYSDYRIDINGNPLSIEMSIYSVDKRWATRQNLRAFFSYPFIQLRLERVQTLCSAQDEGIIMFNRRLGFTQEGIHRKAWHAGGDAISWSMLRDECRWLSRG